MTSKIESNGTARQEQEAQRSILMSGEMVKAVRDGRKTMTRLPFKPEGITIEPHPKGGLYYSTFAKRNHEIVSTGQGPFVSSDWLHYCPFGQVGGVLLVRETRQRTRLASRLLREITELRVERVTEISGEDAVAEGVMKTAETDPEKLDRWEWKQYCSIAKHIFREHWEKIHPGSWERGDFVWVLSFRPILSGANQ